MILIVSPAAVPGCKLVPIFPTTIYWERQPERERERERERSGSYARKFAKSCHLPALAEEGSPGRLAAEERCGVL